ncbi:MAG: transaldolase [Betaproteobacteria bacterium RBG_16_64_9]|nr:MAG: transaldolase [Betaproteobacteria bacterium RBG_16_64_9]OGA33782.1 MAG: transaldolase [Betaproteobacteria bacterium RIFCSPLOWO2_12_FULL_62_13b]
MSPVPADRTVNPVRALQAFGQSVWLDYIRRDLLSTGELARLVRDDGLRGLTSNPAIFEKAFSSGEDYASTLLEAARASRNPYRIYEALAFGDIRDAADALRAVYEATGGADGFVSLEVAPDLAHDTVGTLAEARRLWREAGRDNLMVKVPGTPAGVPAIKELIAEGINVNVTLLFARSAYEKVAEAHMSGLEHRAASGKDIGRVASVASFFVSRIDSAVDAELERRMGTASAAGKQALSALLGKTAIANAKLAYETYRRVTQAERWQKLATLGAKPQRLLWASTSTKNPKYRDVLYVEELIGPHTVNTMPPATLDAFRDHGVPRPSLQEALDEARAVLAELETHGIRLDDVTARLLDEGVALFSEAFARLLSAVEARVRSIAA